MTLNNTPPFAVVLVSSNAEWRVVRAYYTSAQIQSSPFGEWFSRSLNGREVVFFQGGWGKIAAAASAQYALDRWSSGLLVNLGTCGGFTGLVERGALLLVERTLVYDIIEQMSDPDEAIAHYTVRLDLSWLRQPYPLAAQPGLLVSADRDICPADIPMLSGRYQAVAADWESGAIAWVASRWGARCLILRGVSDLVGAQGGEAYSAPEVFQAGARAVMLPLLESLPAWLDCVGPG